MRYLLILIVLLSSVGCISQPTVTVRAWELELKERGIDPQKDAARDPVVAGWLGLIPMAGPIYNGEPSMALIDLICYPFGGPLWNWKDESDMAYWLNVADAALREGLYKSDGFSGDGWRNVSNRRN